MWRIKHQSQYGTKPSLQERSSKSSETNLWSFRFHVERCVDVSEEHIPDDPERCSKKVGRAMSMTAMRHANRIMNERHSQEPVSWLMIPLRQSLEPEETGPMFKVSLEMGNDVPPKVKLTEGKRSHGTAEG